MTWWMIPAAITVLAFLFVLFVPLDEPALIAQLIRLLMMTPALLVCLLAWAVAGALK